ncbi:MAG: hypothetical protein HYX66_08495 [Ignavibacteria bacterium]|nr:hypothetical protein [Ignavibacteria bacterium]
MKNDRYMATSFNPTPSKFFGSFVVVTVQIFSIFGVFETSILKAMSFKP